MASAIGTALFCSVLQPMADKAMDIIKDKGLEIGKHIANKAVDKEIVNIERDISKLQTTLYVIQDIVRVAEEKQINKKLEKNQVSFIQNWLRDLVDIGYEARDVLDDFITFSSCIITAYEEASNAVNFISSFMLSYFGGLSSDTSNTPLAILNRLAKDIRSVREKFDEMKEEGETFTKLKSVAGGVGSESVSVDSRPEVGPFINKKRDGLFLGREDMKKGIMDKILHPSDDRVDVVVIWGMGGIGKTTLAQSIYNDETVKKVDVPRRWLCVGENTFSAEKVIKEILNDQNTIGIGKLQEKLVEKFEGNRFLIVLDDVWDVGSSEWDSLFNPLDNVGNGGLIIITTRKSEVCTAINTQPTYHLLPLSKEDSWSLFESCAYINGESDTTPELKRIGEDIVKKLNGLPLALKVVGRSLLNKDSSTWTNFLESNKFSEDDEVMSALRWSYNHLPRHLKTCFTYCALFPKDHVFDNEKVLVEMWMAHDLIQKEKQKRPEDVGAHYFKQLVNASLLECVDGKYMMHDLIHDLALLVSNGDFATANGSLTNDQMKKVRHITITLGDYSKIPRLCEIEKLLTLYTTKANIITREKFEYSVLDDVFKQLKSIRVLVLSSYGICEIPDCISELRHLRYLDVSKTGVKSLPNSLCRLYNLQMIAANVVLPRDVVNMVNLRYIRASLSTCKGVGKLTSLQELSCIDVCEGDNIRELGDMQRLRGELVISGLENVTSSEVAAGAELGDLMEKQTLIDELKLVFNQHLRKSTISEQVLDALGCPPNLTYLQIDGYNGLKPPSWMVDGKHKFHKLQELYLHGCPKLESLPPLGGFDKLQTLKLFDCLKLESLLPLRELTSLKHLSLRGVRVKRLQITGCEKLVSVLPVVKNPIMNTANFMKSLSSLEIRDCDGLKRLQLDALVSLNDLDISHCKSLVQITSAICESLEISSCRLLEKMDVARCDSLQVVIKILKLEGCESLRSLNIDIHGLDSLEHLNIHGCPKLELAFEDGTSSSSSSGNSVAVPIHRITTDSTQVFRTLLHHEIVSLESLYIENLGGFENFDETEANNFCKSRSLKFLRISECEDLKSLPPDFHKLSSIEELKINRCPLLQSLPPDFHKLSSLEELYIYDCPLLQSLPPDFHKLSSLSRLKISKCDGLKRLQLDAMVSLKDLDISSCKSLVQITSAICESLEISSCRVLEKMDVARCDSLPVVIKILMLEDCESFRSLSIDIHGLDSLEDSNIRGCPTLELAFADGSSSSSSSGNSVAVPIHRITTDSTQVFRTLLHHEIVSLKYLYIANLGGFENFDESEANNFCKFRSLKFLRISECEDLKSLPPDFHKLSSLEDLEIKRCPQLQSLPPDFHKLSSLKELCIYSCPLLQSLPPDFHKLSALVGLHINDCSQLQSLPADGLPPSLSHLIIDGFGGYCNRYQDFYFSE